MSTFPSILNDVYAITHTLAYRSNIFKVRTQSTFHSMSGMQHCVMNDVDRIINIHSCARGEGEKISESGANKCCLVDSENSKGADQSR
jgi:hypothetical protein